MLRGLILFGALIGAPPSEAAPKLLVVVSVDQMRGDYLDGYGVRFSSGLKILYERGSVWTQAHYAHVPTETGPGHAVILTGKHPAQTGIVANDWLEGSPPAPVYSAGDSVFGRGPERLLAYTVGDALKAKDPASRVVSLSVKDRAAILMGGKKADIAIWLDKKTRAFATSSYYGSKPPWLGDFNARAKAALAKLDVATPEADRLLLDLVEEAANHYQLGEDEHTDILAVSFSATDYVGHKYGPDSPQMRAQLLALDAFLGELIGYFKVRLGPESFDVVLTSDHGVLPVPEHPSGRRLKARRLVQARFEAEIEKKLQALHPAPSQRWLAGIFLPNIYLNRALAESQKLDWNAFLKKAAEALRAVDGLAEVYAPGSWEQKDPYIEMYRRSYFPGRSGHLLARPTAGVLIDPETSGTSHGTPYAYDTHVPLVFWGPDFKLGLFALPVRVADAAPTIAVLLGIDFPPTEGSRVLKEALNK